MEGKMKQTYKLVCHGCGRFHTKDATFFSSPLAAQFEISPDRSLVVPCMGCAECVVLNKDAIRNAFDNGMTPEAFANAKAHVAEFFPEYFAETE
jgi:hypothetical protein